MTDTMDPSLPLGTTLEVRDRCLCLAARGTNGCPYRVRSFVCVL